MTRIALGMGLALSACGGGASAADTAGRPDTAVASAAPPDSLVLETGGYTLWLTDTRPARSESGEACVERSLEIRHDGVSQRVPLLYTRAAPTALEPGFVRAELSLDCRTMAIYKVELATGRPTKLEDR